MTVTSRVSVSGASTASVLAVLCCSRWRLRLLLLVFSLLVVVLEEQEREHAEDAADADANGFTLNAAKTTVEDQRRIRAVTDAWRRPG